ncbi:restriction endonuclease subunit S [Campylobacter coli]|uniref:restriction endonuclease subunit S n=1 Tax=Campylobacter coli TaxID=195 RepID=UPI001BA4FFF2|nr:restriction endonuclease subunit S [Campylobacter coli]MBR8638067.1 restriction endonuclease subunit S [Campylobacter coli]QUJ30328.1 restriction endonuclease subunit S [Campylobacter coli]QUJ32162.1 restriction endonuclease subunit S [Campylobacter coli]
MTNLPQGWEVKKLEEIANIKGGKRLPKGKNLLDNNTKFAYIRVADFQDNGTINLQNIKFINENTYNVLKNYKIYDDNLYISIAGTIGKSGIIPKELNGAILTENAVKLEYIQNNISNKFMYFFTLSNIFKTQIQTSTKIVAQPKLAITRLKQIEIPLPPLKEQERIVGILNESFAKIDESIKILEQDLLNLDELMQSALQKAFNPLKDNAKENYKLPQGWEWKSLEEISENISAGGDKPKNCTESKTAKNQIPVYANGVNNNGLVGYTDKATIIKPSLTISARGTIGFVCIRKEPYFPIVRLISLIPCENILCLHYLYFCLNFFIAKGEGSSIPQLTIPKFKSLQIPLPPLKEQEQIAEHLDELSSHVKNLKQNYQAQIKDLQELKNSLLDKAFKGNL